LPTTARPIGKLIPGHVVVFAGMCVMESCLVCSLALCLPTQREVSAAHLNLPSWLPAFRCGDQLFFRLEAKRMRDGLNKLINRFDTHTHRNVCTHTHTNSTTRKRQQDKVVEATGQKEEENTCLLALN